MTADYTDFVPGAAPVAQSRLLIDNTQTSLAVGSTVTLTAVAVSGTGWCMSANLNNHTSTTLASDLECTFMWSDAATGVNFWNEAIGYTAGPPTAAHIIGGHGPVIGNQLTVKITNRTHSNDAVDFHLRVWENSQAYVFSDVRSRDFQQVGYTTSGSDIAAGILMNTSPAALGTGANWARLLPVYVGKIKLCVHSASGTSDCEVQVSAVGSDELAFSNLLLDAFTDSHGDLNMDWSLPGYECILTAINHNAAAQVVSGAAFCGFDKP